MNLVTPEYVKKRKLDVGSIQDLNHHAGRIPLGGMGGHVQEPLGYVILRVQIPYVPSYDEEQVALVVEDDSVLLLVSVLLCWVLLRSTVRSGP